MESLQNLKLSNSQIGVIVALLLCSIQVNSYLKHRKFVRDYGKADYVLAFNPLSALGMVFGWGVKCHWDMRSTMYRKPQKEIISIEPFLWGAPQLYTNSIEVMRQIAGGGTSNTWYKPEWTGIFTVFWGKNVMAENGAGWRKHRRILQPSFNPKTYEMVWAEATRLYSEMLTSPSALWPTQSGQTISFSQFLEKTRRVALCTILSCGFGISLAWDEKLYADERDRSVSVDEGINIQNDNYLISCLAPTWVLNLPFKKMQRIKAATEAMRLWFTKTIASKKEEIAKVLKETHGDLESESLRKDLFSRLTLASQMSGKYHLEDSEIIGNTWVMSFAGHETTAATIATTLCFLAYHQVEQTIVYDEIRSVLDQSGGQLSFGLYDSLVKTRAAFAEALRMFPSAYILIREASEDTILHVPMMNKDGKIIETSMPIPKGTTLVGDMVGMQYNPRVFPSPEVYKPSRWYNATTDDAYTAFSIGPRACIGKKFALVEAVAFLANILRDYSVEPLLKKGQSVEEWGEKVLKTTEIKITLTIAEAPLIFRRR